MKILDILLLPKSFYRKINEKKFTLLLGIIFIGIFDLLFKLVDKYSDIFDGKPQNAIIQNILLAAASILVLGMLDVLFFSKPLYDIFKKFKRESEMADSRLQLIKLMKVYIAAHFVLIPLEVLLYLAVINIESLSNNVIYLAAFLELTLPILFSAAISRGINQIYKFQLIFSKLVFPLVLIWSYALGYAFSYIINQWIMKLFV